MATTFYEVVRDLVDLCGMDSDEVQFDIDDYAIPPNIYSVSGQFPLQIVIELAHKTNGYVRSKKDGNLWIRKNLYHFDALTVAQALTDAEIAECRQTTEYPQFGNRILVHSSISAGGLNIRIRLRLETSCIRGDGRASTLGEAVVTDGSGNPVADGTGVDWSIGNSALAEWLPTTTLDVLARRLRRDRQRLRLHGSQHQLTRSAMSWASTWRTIRTGRRTTIRAAPFWHRPLRLARSFRSPTHGS